ncbi:MAG: sodium:solute symporter, partial [Saprospiraceae bacterium]|nr:sodium:solute symporter [Saprospiraceae bacterium]
QSDLSGDLTQIEEEQHTLYLEKLELNDSYLNAYRQGDGARQESVRQLIEINEEKQKANRDEVKALMKQVDPEVETNDRDYVFITFILDHLPKGLVGLLLAVILSAAMSSTAAELNALASTTTVDIYKRNVKAVGSDQHYLRMSRLFTLFWGLFAILFATFGTLFENLIQFVNIVGSIFYGTILGIFLVAFYIKFVGARAVFIAALIAEAIVIATFLYSDIGFLWYNLIGCAGVVILSLVLQILLPANNVSSNGT